MKQMQEPLSRPSAIRRYFGDGTNPPLAIRLTKDYTSSRTFCLTRCQGRVCPQSVSGRDPRSSDGSGSYPGSQRWPDWFWHEGGYKKLCCKGTKKNRNHTNIFCDILVSCEIIIVSLCSKFLQKSLAKPKKMSKFATSYYSLMTLSDVWGTVKND